MLLSEIKSFIPKEYESCPLSKTELYYDEDDNPIGEMYKLKEYTKNGKDYIIYRIICGYSGMSQKLLKEKSGESIETPDAIDIFAKAIESNKITTDSEFGRMCHNWYRENYVPGLVGGNPAYFLVGID